MKLARFEELINQTRIGRGHGADGAHGRTLAALKLHLVEGISANIAAKRMKIAPSNVYRALKIIAFKRCPLCGSIAPEDRPGRHRIARPH